MSPFMSVGVGPLNNMTTGIC